MDAKIHVLCDITSVSHILEHVAAHIGSKTWKKIVHMVTLGCIWRIWLARKDKEFNGKLITVSKVIEAIKKTLIFG
ncbi:hypothetical protein HanRHA438_Chr00c04g0845091 [Helianthus annuus]|nr:hypothetical protein HanRHA438_Chr00c04g0845091 [Helianthus annuus]